MNPEAIRTKFSELDNWACLPGDWQAVIIEHVMGIKIGDKPARLSYVCELMLNYGVQGHLNGSKHDFDALIELRDEAYQRRGR